MRLWHKDLIPLLPREQLVAQWRECSAIATNIKTKGRPNHILVNKVMSYPFDDFISYAYYLRQEMTRRGYRTADSVWNKIVSIADGDYNILPLNEIFYEWHNFEYLYICYFNLKEKWMCGGIDTKIFCEIENFVADSNIKDILGF